MSHRTASTSTTAPRAVPRTVCDDPTDDRYVDLVVAIFRCAKADLRHPGYAADAQQWLRSPYATWYAGLLGIDAAARQRLAQDA
jgi:hypothetical protein